MRQLLMFLVLVPIGLLVLALIGVLAPMLRWAFRLSVAGLAACNLSDKDRAAKYIERLKGNRQNMMKQICAARGVLME